MNGLRKAKLLSKKTQFKETIPKRIFYAEVKLNTRKKHQEVNFINFTNRI